MAICFMSTDRVILFFSPVMLIAMPICMVGNVVSHCCMAINVLNLEKTLNSATFKCESLIAGVLHIRLIVNCESLTPDFLYFTDNCCQWLTAWHALCFGVFFSMGCSQYRKKAAQYIFLEALASPQQSWVAFSLSWPSSEKSLNHFNLLTPGMQSINIRQSITGWLPIVGIIKRLVWRPGIMG